MTTQTAAKKTTAKKAAARPADPPSDGTNRPQVDHAAVHGAEREAADKLEAERQQRIEQRDNPPAVHIAWSHVMEEVRGLGKHQRHDSPQAKFNFRGIDAVMNAIGPALRKHQVTILPHDVKVERRDVTTSGGKASRETTVNVTYKIIGPAGDTLFGNAPGEAMDNGDKGTAKAMSVAYRVFLLQALTLPTDEPDPDEEAYQRAPELTPAEKCASSLGRALETKQIDTLEAWAKERNLMGEPVQGPEGQPIPLGDLFDVHRTRVADREARLAHSVGNQKPETDARPDGAQGAEA